MNDETICDVGNFHCFDVCQLPMGKALLWEDGNNDYSNVLPDSNAQRLMSHNTKVPVSKSTNS